MTNSNTASNTQGSEVDDIIKNKEFGSELKRAREKAGLSVSDISEKLLISVDIIMAIENSQTDELPALTFTQGYIRSYARLFDISSDEVIKAYIQVAPNSKPVLTPHSFLPAQSSSNDSAIKSISSVLVLIALIVFVVWFNQTDFSSRNNQAQSLNETAFKIGIPVIHSKSEALKHDSIEVDLQSSQKSRIKLKEKTQQDEALNKQTSIKDKKSITSVMDDKIVLTAIADSWCEVNDSQGRRLYYQLLTKGEEVKLKGLAPFTVFLGNASQVRIEINNKIVDFDNLINANSKIANIKIKSDAVVVSSKK